MTKILITGGAGLVGSAMIRGAPAEWEVHGTQRTNPAAGCVAHTVELSDADAVRNLLHRLRPAVVVHTAYTMDRGERDIFGATSAVVEAVREVGAALVYMSTDALLEGDRAPYDEAAAPAPVHEYGRWKARAEALVRERLPAAAVVRTSLVVSLDPLDPRCAWVARGLQGEEEVSLFADELRCPILADDLAAQLWEICALPAASRAGVWHLAGPEAVSRYTLGVLIAAALGLPPARLVAACSADAPFPRPRDLRLTTARADRELRARARPISQAMLGLPVAAPPPVA